MWAQLVLACALACLAACGGKARAARLALARGDVLLALGEPHLALRAYQGVRPDSLYDAALPGMLAAHEEIGAFDHARELVDEALERVPTHVPLRLSHARLTAALGERGRAFEELHALVQTTPATPELLGLLAALASSERERAGTAERLATFCELAARRGSDAGAELLLPLARLQEQLSQPSAASATRQQARRSGVRDPALARRLAQVYARLSEGVLADELLELALHVAPEDAQSWRELARTRIGLRDFAGAQAALDHLHGFAAGSAATRLLRARLWLGWDQPARARTILQELAHNPELSTDAASAARIQLELGRAHAALGDAAAAEQAYLAALSGEPALEGAQLALAELDLGQARAGRAMERLSLFTEAHPESAAALRLLGRAQLALGNHAGAVQSFQTLCALAPGDAAAHALLAQALSARGEPDAARQELERALALDPGALGPLRTLCELLVARGEQEQAANRIEIALSHGRRPELLTLLGDVRLRLPDAADAAELAYREASPEGAPYPPALLALARLYERQGRTADALLALEAVLPVAADPTPVWLQVARLQAARGDGAEAKYAYEQALAREPGAASVLAELARVHARLLGQPAAAQALAERAYGLAPEDPSVAGTFGWLLLQRGHLDQALPLLREAALAQPSSAQAQLELGTVLQQRGDAQAARPVLQRARELSEAVATAPAHTGRR